MGSRRLFWEIVEQIERRIDAGDYPPGSRLPPERVLAEQFDVSRPTIREAIIALEVRGRVEVKTSSGVYVLDSNKKQQPEIEVSAFELTQARALVEGEAAALAATTITEEELDKLEETLLAMESGINADQADKEFHRIISKATRNKAILMAVEKFWSLRESRENIIQAYAGVCSSSAEARMNEHRNIFNGLKNRNAEKARAAMHEHFNRLINALFEASEAQALEEIKRKSSETRGLYSLNHLVQ
ncbi:FadR family transcriptional regulator [Psychrosphaera sp. B3R10]|uniref:FadR/GntR family transcriptional regulator n=1 Tax=Psychrosphaera algicola TaxID=3023714 RepID=A0ABT5FGK6_9GAMM|nr:MULTISPECIES: FadR/GntR family transcriptional regulator [unclassified Psychrosphaera]MBU2883110.1 FadR family transcriptional regulator [Psychrosphaera sp. I2R16]MBU2988566.1 FadR family transcriptional regulator [Psychrosphaera sp. B3R10]MDC2890389.1 FadR/GntR family transcriptional regulator [Psychrosphaera sp. G1-22]MDO6719629.1 FadR/GntR family transcriptional regulator [Psychrosphaera sp. 1_MG-2023]